MKTKNILLLIFFLLAALVLSALVAGLTSGVDWLKWLTWGDSVGFDTLHVDLSIIDFSVSFHMQVNVLQVIFIIAALFLYRRVR